MSISHRTPKPTMDSDIATTTTTKVSLSTLPSELLSTIAASLPHANSLLSLSQTCRRLQSFVAAEGWHAFVTSHFPGYSGPPLWRDAAHSLTSLSRAWDKRAVNGKFVLPGRDINVRHLQGERVSEESHGNAEASTDQRSPRSTNARPPPRERGRRPMGQTMGYHPVLDVTERWTGSRWTDREEVLAVGAGAEILLRRKTAGQGPGDGAPDISSLSLKGGGAITDDHGHRSSWYSWRDERFTDGKDDVSTVKLLRNESSPGETSANDTDLIVGRVNGTLEHIKVTEDDHVSVVREFATDRKPIRAMNLSASLSSSTSTSDDGLLAVCLGSKDIALYDLSHTNTESESTSPIQPIHSISALCTTRTSRTWATHFLNSSTLAIGHGPSTYPLSIYTLLPSGISSTPTRQFPALRDKVYALPPSTPSTPTPAPPTDAVYSIAPVSESARGSNFTGSSSQVFATGWYSGAIRLHDLRSPEPAVTTFADSMEAGAAVYAVLPTGTGRIVAGTALHAKMLVFDMRSPGGCGYIAPGCESPVEAPTTMYQNGTSINGRSGGSSGYSLFLARDYKSSRKESSVYSLASASPFSPTIYAGLEGSVMQIDLFSSADRFPDSIYRASTDSRVRNQRERFYASLAMMDYGGRGGLLIQRYFGRKQRGRWDDRWLELS